MLYIYKYITLYIYIYRIPRATILLAGQLSPERERDTSLAPVSVRDHKSHRAMARDNEPRLKTADIKHVCVVVRAVSRDPVGQVERQTQTLLSTAASVTTKKGIWVTRWTKGRLWCAFKCDVTDVCGHKSLSFGGLSVERSNAQGHPCQWHFMVS